MFGLMWKSTHNRAMAEQNEIIQKQSKDIVRLQSELVTAVKNDTKNAKGKYTKPDGSYTPKKKKK